MKLAYCNVDFRRLKHYVVDLLKLDDLFLISTYSPSRLEEIGADPDFDGWVCGSHLTVLHREVLFDTRFREPTLLYGCVELDHYVKRIFRVVPSTHRRGI